MNKRMRLTDEFKRAAVAQVVERLGVSTISLHTRKAQFAKSPRVRSKVVEQAAEIQCMMREIDPCGSDDMAVVG